MVIKRTDTTYGAVSSAQQIGLKNATREDRWTKFLRVHQSFITHELAQQHPQFARSLCQLERDLRMEQERLSAQILATLRLKEARIVDLQNVVSEQREQLDVVLDELERRETKEDKGVQIKIERQREDAALQTESVQKMIENVGTQTEPTEEKSSVPELLEKLEMELKMLEEKNLALENQMHQRPSRHNEKMIDNEELTCCLEKLQRGVDAMNLSCKCVESPLLLFAGAPEFQGGEATCVDLEHRLEAQNIRLEHIQEHWVLWREATVQFMKQHDSSNYGTELMKIPPFQPINDRQNSENHSATAQCFTALRGALAQIRQHNFQQTFQYNAKEQQHIVQEFARALTREKHGVKNAAKIVQKWAQWEAKHLREVRALKKGFAEAHSVGQSRRFALLKRIDQLEQRGMELRAEVSAWKKNFEIYRSKSEQNSSFLPFWKPENNLAGKSLDYPQLLVRLATVEQSLVAKDEQLAAANATIKALSSCTTTPTGSGYCVSTDSKAITQLAVDLQQVAKEKLDSLQRRQTELVSVAQYFQAEQKCLQLQSRLEAETKQVASLKAANKVCEHERDEHMRKVEKLEIKALTATIKSPASLQGTGVQTERSTRHNNDDSSALFVALKRLRLVEDDRKSLRERLRHLQQQVSLLQHQKQDDEPKRFEKQTIETNVLKFVAEHHKKCIDQFKRFLDRQKGTQQLSSNHRDYERVKQAHVEWEVFLTHYETLWIAFTLMYSFIEHSPHSLDMADNGPFRCTIDQMEKYSRIEALKFEVVKRDEKILLLQQHLLAQDPQAEVCKFDSSSTSPRSSFHELKTAFVKFQKALLEPASETLNAVPSNEATHEQIPDATPLMEDYKAMKVELDECLANCAHLTMQNVKLMEQVRAKEETIKQQQDELHTKTKISMDKSYSSVLEDAAHLDKSRDGVAVDEIDRKQQECETLSAQLASREAENLTLVQSLCTMKEKCAQNELLFEKELRIKAAEHAESMESYMATVNETLSRIESDKCRVEEENGNLRSELQQVEDDKAQMKQQEAQQCTKGTITDDPFDLAAFTEERLALKAHVEDLELQLARERKLVEVLEQKKSLEEQEENSTYTEALNLQDEYKLRCEAVEEWQDKLQHEFAEYQSVQEACVHESSKRIEFLSACIDEFLRAAEETSSRGGTTLTTNDLYSVVMKLAADSTRTKDKTRGSPDPVSKSSERSDFPILQNCFSSDLHAKPTDDSGGSNVSEAMWWKLRASKLEAYLRSAMLQNDTFEDAMRQLEVSMSDVKQELSSRLARETQLLSQLATLKSELATAKEEAALMAEKYHGTYKELEKQQEEALNRSDEAQRARLTIQRKTELVAQQKTKVLSLQQELDQVSKKVERSAIAEKQAMSLQQKAKDHAHQLALARQSYERCHTDNVRLSIHLEKLKERNVRVVARFKAVCVENAHLKTQNATNGSNEVTLNGKSDSKSCNSQADENTILSTEEIRVLKRRVLQKQDVIVSYKAKLAEVKAQLARQQGTMMKLARSKRGLQHEQRQRQEAEHENSVSTCSKLETQLKVKQEQFDGLRASIYDSFEAFVSTWVRKTDLWTSKVPKPSFMDESEDDDETLFALKRWTDFSTHDLEHLKLARRPRCDDEIESDRMKRKMFQAALQNLENALEVNPGDCRAEICQFLQCL